MYNMGNLWSECSHSQVITIEICDRYNYVWCVRIIILSMRKKVIAMAMTLMVKDQAERVWRRLGGGCEFYLKLGPSSLCYKHNT